MLESFQSRVEVVTAKLLQVDLSRSSGTIQVVSIKSRLERVQCYDFKPKYGTFCLTVESEKQLHWENRIIGTILHEDPEILDKDTTRPEEDTD